MKIKIRYATKGRKLVPVLLDDDAPNVAMSIMSAGYVQITDPSDGTRPMLLHRWLLGLRSHDGRIGDHRNGDKLDNRRSNLRVVSPSESSANVSASGPSGYRGVYRARSGRWIARGKRDGRNVQLGTFDTIEQAACVATDWRRANLPGYVDRAF